MFTLNGTKLRIAGTKISKNVLTSQTEATSDMLSIYLHVVNFGEDFFRDRLLDSAFETCDYVVQVIDVFVSVGGWWFELDRGLVRRRLEERVVLL
jgi:hypothetical protein